MDTSALVVEQEVSGLRSSDRSRLRTEVGQGSVFVVRGGYVEGSTLYGPWHNLPIHLVTGSSPCRTLRDVGVQRRWSDQGADTPR